MGRPKTISDEDMLAAARIVFLKHGAFGSTKEIAKVAGVSEAALFKRYSTKAQLFMAAMTPPTPGIDAIVARAASMRSARQALHALSIEVLDYFRIAIPMVLPLVAHPSFAATDATRNFDSSPALDLVRAVADHFREERTRKRMKLKDPWAAAALLVAALHSVALFEIMGFHDGAMPKAGVRSLVDALWLGLEPVAPVSKRRSRSR